MNIKELRELIGLIDSSEIEEFEMEKAGVRIRVRRRLHQSPQFASAPAETGSLVESAEESAPEKGKSQETEEDTSISTFRAPMVGTFYITPKPDAEPFVQISDQVKKGTVLCTIEAMKIFNQIESDVDGEIVDILVENGQPVEYGEPLFKIRTTS